RARLWRYGRAATLVAIAVALSAGTIARNAEYGSSLSLYRTVVQRWPTSLSHHILGGALMTAGLHEEAITELRAALPGAPRAHYDLGVELFNAGKLDDAITHLQALVDLWQSPPVAHPFWQAPVRGDVAGARLILGRAFAQQRRWPEASHQFEQVVTMAPEHVEAHQLLAASLFSAGRLEQAAAHYVTYLANRPDDVDALTNFGIALVAAGKNDEAVVQFRRAVEVDPENGRLRRNLANSLFDLRQIDEAAVHADRAASLRPDDPAAIVLLGQVLAVQGELAEASRQFERALQLDPMHEDARRHLDMLRRYTPK
ncbi:MAG: tetratricopeptide repeat protein, partial [Luteitalea sp.]|nr:tetratricopeptide repeat protein [Luteitalea sp.]